MVRSRTAGSRGPARKRRSTDPAQRLGRASEAPVTTAPHVLRDYAFLGDGHRGALLGPQGDCAWLCFPSWSDPAVFASLIGSGGQYLVQPTGRWVWGGCYDDGSLVWTSRWVTEDGIVESREALVYPGDADRAVLLRRVRAGDAGARVL
ncbi:MAG TPA: trehalase-like domain-containing protein, partial [Acidimicrobiales bacterium]|nr:trehalase-like domain-containing protein [Acidimicrobiales bacterium]